jgi:type IV pilus modification protein PilV
MKARAGFTLVEVVISMAILIGVIVTLITLTGRTVHITAQADREQAAIQMATDRTDQIRSDPNYAALDTAYAKTETNVTAYPGLTRTTTVTRITTSGNDFKRFTVKITGAGLQATVARTISVAAP